jgi:hypothetical protein
MTKNALAKYISVVFHPACLQAAFICYPSNVALVGHYGFMATLVLLTAILPLLLSGIYLILIGHQEFFSIPKEKRYVPFLISLVILISVWYYLRESYPDLSAKILQIFILNTIAFFVTFKEKVSLHVYGLISLSILWFPTFGASIILFLPLVVFARMELKAHTNFQLMAGGILGGGIAILLKGWLLIYGF